jgi:hypothetical protein
MQTVQTTLKPSTLQWFEEKAHEFSRGMNPTPPETTPMVSAVECDAESEVRIRTPPWRYMKPAISAGGRTVGNLLPWDVRSVTGHPTTAVVGEYQKMPSQEESERRCRLRKNLRA